MKKHAIKPLKLSRWHKWPIQHPEEFSGVYVLAHLPKPPKGTADHTMEEVVYIGETSKPLRLRWAQFSRSARTKDTRGHSGGRAYFNEFKGLRKDLHVAWLPITEKNPSLRDAKIKYWERCLLLQYAESRHEAGCEGKLLPACNKR